MKRIKIIDMSTNMEVDSEVLDKDVGFEVLAITLDAEVFMGHDFNMGGIDQTKYEIRAVDTELEWAILKEDEHWQGIGCDEDYRVFAGVSPNEFTLMDTDRKEYGPFETLNQAKSFAQKHFEVQEACKTIGRRIG
jgi:hypothetical protein